MQRDLIDFWKASPDDPFDVLFEQAPVLMHSIDASGKLIQVSRFWADFLGFERSEMIGHLSTDFLSPASRLKARERILPKFMKTGRIHNAEFDFVAKSGELIAVRLSATSVLDESGSIERSLAILFDNRDTKAAEAALAAKAAEADAANQAKSRFLAAMSHEIRTPMNAIMGFAELLKMSVQDAKAASHADAILTAGGSLMVLLNDLLDLSQPETHSDRSVSAPGDLHSVIAETADWWRREAVRKGLELSLGIDVNVPSAAEIDAPRIQKLLNNLIGNAVKFTKEGQVALRVARDAATGMTTFTVTDSGAGLSEDVQAHVAQHFADARQDYAKQRGGIGLGLSVCQNLVRQLGGTFSIENRTEGGCQARFSIPIKAADVARRSNGTLTAEPDRAEPNRIVIGKNVLVAEDNPLNRELMRTLLESIGCKVSLARDGFEAVEIAGQGGFDAILMDISMPKMDGVAAAEQIQGLPTPLCDVPIIACTAHVDEQAQARYRRAGMAGFLPKPVRSEDITALLGQVTEEQARARTN